jgi:hypothetical protein
MFALPLLGGGAIMAGVLLPWMTFYAGLQRLNGLQGVHGWWLLSAGVAAVVLTALQWRTPRTWRALLLLALGAMASAACALLLVRASRMHDVPAMLMLVPRMGPGLYVSLFGALAVTIGGAVQRRVRRCETAEA